MSKDLKEGTRVSEVREEYRVSENEWEKNTRWVRVSEIGIQGEWEWLRKGYRVKKGKSEWDRNTEWVRVNGRGVQGE